MGSCSWEGIIGGSGRMGSARVADSDMKEPKPAECPASHAMRVIAAAIAILACAIDAGFRNHGTKSDAASTTERRTISRELLRQHNHIIRSTRFQSPVAEDDRRVQMEAPAMHKWEDWGDCSRKKNLPCPR